MDIKTVYGRFLNMLIRTAGIDQAKKFDTWFRFHRKLDLKLPKTLADKVTYIELHDQSPLASVCTDKFAVRDYVAQKGYEHALVPLAGGAWSDVDEIDFTALPDNFIFKATHGCKMNYPVPDKTCLDIENCKKTLRRWLDTTYGVYSMEPHYSSIPHRVYAEKLIGGGYS